jgi:hypothetical protein
MPFGVIWHTIADADLGALARRDAVAASLVLDQIYETLAVDLVSVALRPSFPHPLLPKFQFWVNATGGRFHVTVLFRYLTNEKDIEIRAIGWVFVGDEENYPFG